MVNMLRYFYAALITSSLSVLRAARTFLNQRITLRTQTSVRTLHRSICVVT